MKTTPKTSNGEILQQAIADRVPHAVNTATRKDSTLRVCEHVEMFTPERWKSHTRWEYKRVPSQENNEINKRLRKESRIESRFSALMGSGRIDEAMKLLQRNPNIFKVQ
jgi:hypothetical protein